MATDTLRLGVIGCGNMATHHVGAAAGKCEATSDELRPYAEKVEVHGLADVDLSKAEGFKEKYGGEYATDDPERIINDKNIDIVQITTWHDTHAPFSLAAIQAGKHVLIEKPMCMTEQECDDIVAAVEGTGLKYMPAFRCRFASGAKDVKREFPNPENTIAHARTPGIWPETSWAQDPIKGGGQILSQGCHVVDMMFFLAGAEPESVYATGGVFHHDSPKVIDTINAAVRYKNGSVGAFLGGDGGTGNLMIHHPLPCKCPFFVMVTDKGRSGLAIDHGQDARFEGADAPYADRVYSQEDPERASGLGDILPALAKAIIEDEEPPANEKDGARATRFILKCFESARTGQIVTF